MADKQDQMPNLQDICNRYAMIHTGAISDVLDGMGYRNQALPNRILPLTSDTKVAGPAFTGMGQVTIDVTNNDMPRRLEMLKSIPPLSVSVWSTSGHLGAAHWGELMSTAARNSGCTGAVIDGGVRDSHFLLRMGFPVFASCHSVASSIGRWEILACQIPISIGTVEIRPADFVVGDIDGVVIVPQHCLLQVLEKAEELREREAKMRADIDAGMDVEACFKKYGAM